MGETLMERRRVGDEGLRSVTPVIGEQVLQSNTLQLDSSRRGGDG